MLPQSWAAMLPATAALLTCCCSSRHIAAKLLLPQNTVMQMNACFGSAVLSEGFGFTF
jgi:hypothetical protein